MRRTRFAVVMLSLGLAASAAGAAAPNPQIPVGGFPTGIAIDPVTHTVYVGNETTNTLSLIDGSTCNAGATGGCGRHVSAVTAGIDPIGIAVDGATGTIYVANASGSVAVLARSHCRVAHPALGCTSMPATVRVGANPQFLALDQRTHTIYVANTNSNTVSVIDVRRCGGPRKAGCARVRATVPAGPAPFAVAVDERTETVYVAALGAPTVAVIDGATCNAAVTTGCRRRPASVDVGQTPGGVAVDSRTNTIYVTGQASNDVSVIDGRTCNGRTASGCRKAPLHVGAGLGARGIAVDEATGTVYVANTGDNTVSVIDGTTCNAAVHAGCGQHAAAALVGISPRRVAIDQRTGTVYVTNAGSDSVTILNGRTCNGRVHTGCGPVATVGGGTGTAPAPASGKKKHPYSA